MLLYFMPDQSHTNFKCMTCDKYYQLASKFIQGFIQCCLEKVTKSGQSCNIEKNVNV